VSTGFSSHFTDYKRLTRLEYYTYWREKFDTIYREQIIGENNKVIIARIFIRINVFMISFVLHCRIINFVHGAAQSRAR